MICKKCHRWNYNEANFCFYCGGELYAHTIVSLPIQNTVTACSAPAVGVRFFNPDMGNAMLQTAFNERKNGAIDSQGGIQCYGTRAKVKTLRNGTWFCPDCGEKNSLHSRSCIGCGKYR